MFLEGMPTARPGGSPPPADGPVPGGERRARRSHPRSPRRPVHKAAAQAPRRAEGEAGPPSLGKEPPPNVRGSSRPGVAASRGSTSGPLCGSEDRGPPQRLLPHNRRLESPAGLAAVPLRASAKRFRRREAPDATEAGRRAPASAARKPRMSPLPRRAPVAAPSHPSPLPPPPGPAPPAPLAWPPPARAPASAPAADVTQQTSGGRRPRPPDWLG